jgi:hypothetical protein
VGLEQKQSNTTFPPKSLVEVLASIVYLAPIVLTCTQDSNISINLAKWGSQRVSQMRLCVNLGVREWVDAESPLESFLASKL